MGLRYREREHRAETAAQVNPCVVGRAFSFRRDAMAWLLAMSLVLLPACSRFQLPLFNSDVPEIDKSTPAQPPTVVIAPKKRGPGIVRGRIVTKSGNPDSVAKANVIIFAERLGSKKKLRPGQAATIRRQGADFSPELTVVSIDQTVHFRDDGDLFHRIFSYSEPNAFDLGITGDGEYNSVVFHHPGLVRFYCSLHGWESGSIFVTPSPHFDRARPGGEYELVDLPPGQYRIAAWGEEWEGPGVDVVVKAGRSTAVELSIEPVREVR